MSPIAASAGGFKAPGVEDFWQPLFGTDGPFAITRPAVVLVLSVALIAVVLLVATRRLAVVPTTKGQFLTESAYSLVRNSVAREVIGSREFLRFVPLLFTLFTLILVNNVFAIIPPIQYPTMSRIGFPIALVLFVYPLYHYLGIRKRGLVGYLKHLVPADLPGWLIPLIFFLEVVDYFLTRPMTLALRLFGNMFAGHLLLLLAITGGQYLVFDSGSAGQMFAGVFAYGGGFVMTLFELLVEFLQAYIFVLLTAMYIAGALADDH